MLGGHGGKEVKNKSYERMKRIVREGGRKRRNEGQV